MRRPHGRRPTQIGRAARLAADKLAAGGRLVYVGAGTSGRLGTLDAVECVPTFGVPPSRLVADHRRRPLRAHPLGRRRRGQHRDAEQRMRRVAVGPADVVCGVAASGVTPFVRAALEYARFRRAATIFVTCAPRAAATCRPTWSSRSTPAPRSSPARRASRRGPPPRSSLNAISTAAFVLLGKTYAGLMVDVRPTNAKLWARAIRIVSLPLRPGRGGRAQADREGRRSGQGRARHAPRRRLGGARARAAGDAQGLAAGDCRRSAGPRADRGLVTANRARDPLARLQAARERRERLVIGLLSGTSADGTDAALCAIEGVDDTTRCTVRGFVSTPFARPLRERIFRLAQANASELCDLDVLLGEAFAEAAVAVAPPPACRSPTSTSSARTARPPCTTRARRDASAPRCRSARRRSSPSGPAARW